MDWKCKNNPDSFCYICSNVVLPNRQAKITDFVKKAYRDDFRVKLGDQDNPFLPICVQNLRNWRNGKRKTIPFAILGIWREGKEGINRKKKHYVPEPDDNMEYSSDSEYSDMTAVAGDEAYKPEADDHPVPSTKINSTTWHETWNFYRSLLSCWVHALKRNIFWLQEQRSTRIETVIDN